MRRQGRASNRPFCRALTATIFVANLQNARERCGIIVGIALTFASTALVASSTF
jgi:hypothetical protein